jgi:hypothetical protein
MICKKCGYEIEDESLKTCPVCGEALGDETVNNEVVEETEVQSDTEATTDENVAEEGGYIPAPPKKSGVGGKIAAGVIILALLGGTGYMAYNNSDRVPRVDYSSIEKVDAFEGIDAKYEVTDKDSVVKAFSDALEGLDDADSATIATTNSNSTNDGSEQLITMLVKRQLEEGNQVASVDINQSYTYPGSTEDSTGDSAGTPQTETNEVNYYYADGMLYCDTGDSKMQMEVSNEDILSQLNSYSMEIYAEYISKATCEEKGKNKKYTVSMDPQAYQEFMLSNMAAQGAGLDDNETMELTYANLMFEIDENGALVQYAFVIDLTDTIDGEATEYKSRVTVSVSDFNKTKVTKLSEDELKAYAGEEEEEDESSLDFEASEGIEDGVSEEIPETDVPVEVPTEAAASEAATQQ